MKGNKRTRKNIRVMRLFLTSLLFVVIAGSVAVAGFNYMGNRNFKETFYSVSSLKVNNKIRIVQISDLHNCLYGNENEKIVERVKKLRPDLILYTGDMIDSAEASDDRVVNLCKALSSFAPSYYIFGNNEVEKYYDVLLNQEALDEKFGFNDNNREPEKLLEMTDALTKKLEAASVKVLKNQYDTITVGTTQVDIYGVLTSNPSAFWSYAGKTFDEYIYTNENHLKITAIHEPLLFEEYAPEAWGDLMLAGHNHGGTIRVPMLGPVYTHDGGLLPEKRGHYVSGRYEVVGRPLIISAGLENKDIFRINNQPEIVIVDINKF